MVYEANYYISGEDPASISIPDISQILIIGNSHTSIEFTLKIKNIARFQKIYHVDGIKNATGLMENISFAIIVVDADDEFDPIGCSRIIRIHNSQSRIVMISKKINERMIFDLKNKGIIHGFISIPCEDLFAHTIIVQEQAKFHINQSLRKILQTPPKHTSSHRAISSSKIHQTTLPKFDLMGCAIVESTVSKFNIFFDTLGELHPYLLSSYFSAISILGTKVLASENDVNLFEFNDLNIYVKQYGEIQYVFFLKNVSDENQIEILQYIRSLANKLHIKFEDQIANIVTITDDLDNEIKKMVVSHLPAHQHDSYFYEPEEKVKIINFHEPSNSLLGIYDETSIVYDVHYVDEETQLLDMLNDGNFELIIINNFEDDFHGNKALINIVKDESPFTQSLAVLKDLDKIPLVNVLNINDLDFILDANSDEEEYYSIVKKAIERSRAIKKGGIQLTNLSSLPRSYDLSEIIKTMLRKNIDRFDTSTIPEFYGLFILVENMRYYSNYWVDDIANVLENEYLFISFIESLLTFTDELSHSPLALTGIKYGSSHLMIQTHFEYTMIFFIGNLDNTNYDLIKQTLATKSLEIYTTAKQGDAYFITDDVSHLIDQICLDIKIQFSILEEQSK